MKSTLSIMVLFLATLAFAQKSGTIIYNQERKMEMPEAKDGDKERFASLMSSMNLSKKQLDFTATESIFYDITGERSAESKDADASGGERNIVIKMPKNEEQFYKDFTSNTYVNKQDLFGKFFLIKEAIVNPKWKISNEQKKIGKHVCIKATATSEKGENVVAWFAPEIAISNGPEIWGGLPGLILELNQNDGEFVFTVEDIQMVNQVEIIKPSKGDNISLKKFNELEEKKRQEMKEMYGGNGNMIIIKSEDRH